MNISHVLTWEGECGVSLYNFLSEIWAQTAIKFARPRSIYSFHNCNITKKCTVQDDTREHRTINLVGRNASKL
jgi:hypothetical protein